MEIREEQFRAILCELADENPWAVRPLLKILEVRFTDAVPTLAVTCEARPALAVNLGFVNRHCRTDCHVKALVCHELLHVTLNHTEKWQLATPMQNLALDAVINAVIHRTMGEAYSSLMAEYYAGRDFPLCLLRPPGARMVYGGKTPDCAWGGLYLGFLVADDILEILDTLLQASWAGAPFLPGDLLGNHDAGVPAAGGALEEAVREALREMDGSEIWRDAGSRGVGPGAFPGAFVSEETEAVEAWKRKTMAVLQACLTPDRHSRLREEAPLEYRLPLMHPRDKRAFLKSLWSPFLPDAAWETAARRPRGSANVYLDVSGSMRDEMPYLVALLNRLRAFIRTPFWAFSTVVGRAVIEHGELRAHSTGGTSINCVLEHISQDRPRASVIVTDGFVERVDGRLLAETRSTRIRVLVTRNGSPAELERAGIPCTQLERVPR